MMRYGRYSHAFNLALFAAHLKILNYCLQLSWSNSENIQLLGFFTVPAQHLGNSLAFLVWNLLSATLQLPLEGGDEKQNTIVNSFMNIFSLNSDISKAWIGNASEKPGRTTIFQTPVETQSLMQHP